jgi:hypothetical protein
MVGSTISYSFKSSSQGTDHLSRRAASKLSSALLYGGKGSKLDLDIFTKFNNLR